MGCRWKSTFKVKIILTKDHNPFYILNLCWSYTHNIFKFNPNKHASRGHHVIAEMENRKNFGQRAFTTCMSIYTTVSLQAKYKILLFTKWQLSLLTITSHSIPPQWPGLAYFTMYYYSSFFSFFFSFSWYLKISFLLWRVKEKVYGLRGVAFTTIGMMQRVITVSYLLDCI